MLLKFSAFLLQTLSISALNFIEPFKTQENLWLQTKNAAQTCSGVQKNHESHKLELQQKEFDVDHGYYFRGDGVEDVGLLAKHEETAQLNFAKSLTLGFTVQFDQLDTIDCTEIKVQLFEKGEDPYFCPDGNVGLSLGLDMCRSRYQLTAQIFYEKELYQLNKYINMIDLIPSAPLENNRIAYQGNFGTTHYAYSNQKWTQNNRHPIQIQIFKNDTYQIQVDDKFVDQEGNLQPFWAEAGRLEDDFNLRGEKMNILPKEDELTGNIIENPIDKPPVFTLEELQAETDFFSSNIIDRISQWAEYLEGEESVMEPHENPNYIKGPIENILQKSMFKSENQVHGVGVYVQERGFSSGPIIDDIIARIE